jgi:hypothetical protein
LGPSPNEFSGNYVLAYKPKKPKTHFVFLRNLKKAVEAVEAVIF